MLYWLIPYLVAYNVSDSGDWRHGPEYVFKTEIYINVTSLTEVAAWYSDITMNIACRPMNSSLIQCRIDPAKVDNYEGAPGSNLRKKLKWKKRFEIDNAVFQVLFDEEGISRVWFLNTNGSYTLNMIRAIIGTMNTGINPAGKELEEYVSLEKSIIGICDTRFNIRKNLLSEEDNENATVIDGFKFDVSMFDELSDDETIVIEKYRNPNECVKETPYFFGSTVEEDTISDMELGVKSKTLITHSQSRIYLGGKSFSAYTENNGTFIQTFSRIKPRKTELSIGEIIRVSLQSIQPAKKEMWNDEDLIKVGVGFGPGTPWPK